MFVMKLNMDTGLWFKMKNKKFFKDTKSRKNSHLKINAQGDFAYYPLRRIQNQEDFAYYPLRRIQNQEDFA